MYRELTDLFHGTQEVLWFTYMLFIEKINKMYNFLRKSQTFVIVRKNAFFLFNISICTIV